MKQDIETLYNTIIEGNIISLSKAITLIESNKADDKEKRELLIQKAKTYNSKSIRIGITGTPGVGKSTFIEAIGLKYINQGLKVAVLAIDPSSKITKGSILGDKTRMELLAKEKNAFIRPSPTGGELGGITARTRETVILCELAGYDIILIETVGVGQSETAVKSIVDLFILLLQPGGGDDLQGIKKGVVELADLLIINKSDGENEKLSNITKNDYNRAMKLIGNKNKILKCSALTGMGIDEIVLEIDNQFDELYKNNLIKSKRLQQEINWFNRELEKELINKVFTNKNILNLKNKLADSIMKNELSIYDAIDLIIDKIKINK